MQIGQILAALGLTGINADTANEGAILAAMQGMREKITAQAQQIDTLKADAPTWPVADALPDLYEAAIGRINAAMEADKVPPVIAEALRERCGTAEKPNAFMFARFKQLDGKRPIDMVLDLHANAAGQQGKDVPNKGEESPSQRITQLKRPVPGGEKKDENAPMSEARRKELLNETPLGRAIVDSNNGKH